MNQTPMAFLLVKFKGSNDEPIIKADADQMFTAAGRGTMNVVDWFDDNTHGHVDMSGNAVFGWLELAETLDGYQTKRTNGTYGRWMIIELGNAAAATAGIDLSTFTAVVVVTNLEVDLFGGTGGVCCTAAMAQKQFWENQAAPSVLCQEMIHGLGVYNHARRADGSDADYRDPYDVMSMFNAWPGHHPTKADVPIGPGLNAAFMQRCGWLDTTRAAPIGQAALRPLHRRDLPGPLYSKVGDYYVEYRPSRRWDTGFPSVVLVHYIANETSYLVAELRSGAQFSWGYPGWPFKAHGFIKVDDIDDVAETATVTTSYAPARPVPVVGPAWSLFLEDADGGGLVILGGRIIKIPPHSPELRLVEVAATLASINDTQLAPALKTAMRADIYAQIVAEIGEAHEHITGSSSPFDHISTKEARAFHRRDAAK